MPEVVILIGLPGSGKSTFCRTRFADTHEVVSRDLMRSARRPAELQGRLIGAALSAGRSVVVDNTNASAEERAATIAQARARGAQVIGYFFDVPIRTCLARNATREGRARVPPVAVLATAKRLRPPERGEGFDRLFRITPDPTGAPRVEELQRSTDEGDARGAWPE